MHRNLIRVIAALVAAFAALTAGCSSGTGTTMAAGVSMTDQWANAAHSGMAAVFGTLHNAGARPVQIVSGSSPLAARVEVHEVVPDATGTPLMQPKEGGATVPADGRLELAPGGDHLMLMDLRRPLHPGDEVPVTMTFQDGSTLTITAQVRDFPGADEQYHSDHG